jgi:hypothetical protein
MLKHTFTVYFLSACLLPIFGQKLVTIKLDNPSFEDFPGAGHTPKDWLDCGFPGETAPDVQPSGAFDVNKPPFNGSTYLGMVVRDNNTWEAVGQKLSKQLFKDIKYTFSIYACQSETYISKSRITGDSANYIVPSVIKIWGGNGSCTKNQLLAQSQPIDFKDWKKLEFILSPKANYRYIMIEAFYIKVFKNVYNGNILIDNASVIVPILDNN